VSQRRQMLMLALLFTIVVGVCALVVEGIVIVMAL
jgi:hypothetical protein